MAKSADEDSKGLPDHIEQIRNIIVGPQKREYEERFGNVLAEIERLREEARLREQETRHALTTGLAAAHTSGDQKLQEFGAKLKAEAANLQEAIERSGDRSTKELAGSMQAVNDAHSSLRKELDDLRSQMQSDMNATRNHILKELDERFAALHESKVSRDVMAEILHELAIRLKGVEVMEELKKAARR